MKDDFKEFVDNYKKDPEKVKQKKQAKLVSLLGAVTPAP